MIVDGVSLRFSDNTANQNGGAIANVGTIDSISNRILGNYYGFYGNQALGNVGDGVGGAIVNEGTINTINTIFDSNTAKGQGGAIYNGLPSGAQGTNSKTITTIN